MANPLTFIMPIAADADVETLLADLGKSQVQVDLALKEVGTVHFARFVLFDASSPYLLPCTSGPLGSGPFCLSVITDYDGSFDAYIEAFVRWLGPIFDTLLSFSADGTQLIKVKDNVAAFEAYITAHDASQQPPNSNIGLYSAYPWTVQQIEANAPSE
jgi:hypothetical protein